MRVVERAVVVLAREPFHVGVHEHAHPTVLPGRGGLPRDAAAACAWRRGIVTRRGATTARERGGGEQWEKANVVGHDGSGHGRAGNWRRVQSASSGFPRYLGRAQPPCSL